MKAVTRPILRYHGGKWMLADWIINHFPPHRVYVEPFAGGASVLMQKERSYAEIYNDLDGEVVNLFRVVRDQGAELLRALELTPFARTEHEQSYIPSKDPVDNARKMVFRSMAGFGSAVTRPNRDGSTQRTGFRSKSFMSGTAPSSDWRHYPYCLPAMVERLRGVAIENRPAIDVMRQYDAVDTLHYVDPPYVHSTRKASCGGTVRAYKHEMSDADHVAMAEVLNGLAGMVIVSGYPSELYEDLFSGWRRIERDAFADGASPRTEVLWMRNIPDKEPSLFSAAPARPAAEGGSSAK